MGPITCRSACWQGLKGPLCPRSHVQCEAAAVQVRTLVQRELHRALEQYDCLLSPVAPTTAFQLGEKSSDPLTMYRSDIMTTTLNLAGKL